jgi:hypothetical protein
MASILYMDFELNKPLTYLAKFRQLLSDEGWDLDLFWASDYAKKDKPSIDKKINDADLLLIRKPLTFLTGPQVRKKLQDAILKKKKNLLVMYTFTERESLDVLNEFLRPFKINTSDLQLIDDKTNQQDRRNVVFQKKNDCFYHDELFKGVSKLLIPHPHMIFVESPAKVLIRGNPTTELKYDFIELTSNLGGNDLIAGAYYNEKNSGRMIVIDSTLFLDKYFDFNKKFVKNVLTWLGNNKEA